MCRLQTKYKDIFLKLFFKSIGLFAQENKRIPGKISKRKLELIFGEFQKISLKQFIKKSKMKFWSNSKSNFFRVCRMLLSVFLIVYWECFRRSLKRILMWIHRKETLNKNRWMYKTKTDFYNNAWKNARKYPEQIFGIPLANLNIHN